jgi:hypothetical protein
MNQHSKITAQPLFLIETDHGRIGLQVIGYPEDTRRKIVEQFADGEHMGKDFHVSRILEILADGHWSDVTEDIAIDVRVALLEKRKPISPRMKEWLHRVLGVMATHGMLEEETA